MRVALRLMVLLTLLVVPATSLLAGAPVPTGGIPHPPQMPTTPQ